MTRQIIIERTLNAINQLPEDKAVEILDFADFVFKRYEEQQITKGKKESKKWFLKARHLTS
jgi:hypothetical protein